MHVVLVHNMGQPEKQNFEKLQEEWKAAGSRVDFSKGYFSGEKRHFAINNLLNHLANIPTSVLPRYMVIISRKLQNRKKKN